MMFQLYLINISDNIHMLAALTSLFLGIFLFMSYGISFNCDAKTMKIVFITFLISLGLYVLTPSSWKHDMNMQYIKKAGQLELEKIELEKQLIQYQTKEF